MERHHHDAELTTMTPDERARSEIKKSSDRYRPLDLAVDILQLNNAIRRNSEGLSRKERVIRVREILSRLVEAAQFIIESEEETRWARRSQIHH